jgi:hypothetical protein
MKLLVLSVLLVAGLPPAQSTRTFTGAITDGMCPSADHSQMRMGSTDAECAIACVDAHGSQFVLFDGKNAYTLSDQKVSERFAGKRVTVTGSLHAGGSRIEVESISLAK